MPTFAFSSVLRFTGMSRYAVLAMEFTCNDVQWWNVVALQCPVHRKLILDPISSWSDRWLKCLKTAKIFIFKGKLFPLKFPFQWCITWLLLKNLIFDPPTHKAKNDRWLKMLIKKVPQHFSGCMKLILCLWYL